MSTFWCIVEGDNIPFAVIGSSPIASGVLKTKIKESESNLLQGVDSSRLILWKPLEVIPVGPSDNLAKRIRNLGPDFSQFAKKLDPIELVTAVNLNQTSYPQLDVIVQLPAQILGKRSRGADDPQLTGLAWLEELHSKIWNREDLKPTFFRTVEVTRALYDALQDRLNEKYPDRGSDKYDGRGHDVLSEKLDILKLATPVEARRLDNYEDQEDDNHNLEASNEIDSEINSFFPFTLRYLDLSILQLKQTSDRFHLAFLLRHEYDHISELINRNPRNASGSVIVTGQPEVGNTTYLYLKMIESLIAGRPFLYQTKEGAVYHVTQNGVEAIWSWSLKTHIVAFVDGDKGDSEPRHFLSSPLIQIIVATSPKGAYHRWIKHPGIHIMITKLATCLWSRRELFLTGIFLYPRDITFKLLRESASYFGCNPRRCFDSSCSVTSLEATKEEVLVQIKNIAGDTNSILKVLGSCQTGADTVSHTIFQLQQTDELRRLVKCQCEAVSQWVFDSLLNVCESETREADVADRLYRNLSRTSSAVLLRGCLFKRRVLKYLDAINSDCNLSIRELNKDGQAPWIYRGQITRVTYQESTVVDQIEDAVVAGRAVHLVPSVTIFPAVDSIVYQPGEALTLIQVTIKESKHPITIKGLQRIQKWLKDVGPSAKVLIPQNNNPWRLVFIVPQNMAPGFKLQPLADDTDKGEWAGKVKQYVLGLDVGDAYNST